MKKKQDVSKNMPSCHFLSVSIIIAIMLIYKEFFKKTKISKMVLRIGFAKLLMFCLHFNGLFVVIPR